MAYREVLAVHSCDRFSPEDMSNASAASGFSATSLGRQLVWTTSIIQFHSRKIMPLPTKDSGEEAKGNVECGPLNSTRQQHGAGQARTRLGNALQVEQRLNHVAV